MRQTLLIFLFILSFIVMFSLTLSGARAASLGDAKKELTSILHLKAADLLGQRSNPGERGDHESKPLPEFHIPLSKGVKAFLGLTSPHQYPDGADVRAVFGFHIPLK